MVYYEKIYELLFCWFLLVILLCLCSLVHCIYRIFTTKRWLCRAVAPELLQETTVHGKYIDALDSHLRTVSLKCIFRFYTSYLQEGSLLLRLINARCGRLQLSHLVTELYTRIRAEIDRRQALSMGNVSKEGGAVPSTLDV